MQIGKLGAWADRLFSDRVILLLGWLWFLVYAYPGYMSYDSVYQLAQARHIDPVNEWHPPIMTFLWRIVDSIIAGPFPMLVIQSVTLLAAMYVLFARVMSGRAAAITAAIILVIPQNIIVMAVIWKDSQMAAYLLASIVALLSEKRRWRVAGCVLLFLATSMRYNAAAATLPILLLLWDPAGKLSRLRRYATAIGVWLGIAVLSVVLSAQLVQERKYPWPTGSAPVDIVGIIRFSPKLTDEQLLRDTEGVPWLYKDKIQSRTRTTYQPGHSFLDITQTDRRLMDWIGTDEQRAAVTNAWRTLVVAHPLAFLRHRWAVFNAQLKLHPLVWAGFTNADWGEDLVKHRANHSMVQQAWIDALVWFGPSNLMRARLWFVLALVLLPLAWRQRVPFVLLASGVLYQLGLFLVAPATDYRYSHWMVLATILATVMLVATRIRARSGVGADRRIERAA